MAGKANTTVSLAAAANSVVNCTPCTWDSPTSMRALAVWALPGDNTRARTSCPSAASSSLPAHCSSSPGLMPSQRCEVCGWFDGFCAVIFTSSTTGESSSRPAQPKGPASAVAKASSR